MTIRAYLVDLDGTLADTGEANFQAYAMALHEVGIAIDRPTFDRTAFGRNWRQFLPGLMAGAGKDVDAAQVADRKKALYLQTVARVGFNEALIALLQSRPRDTCAALVTTASASNVAAVLAQRPDVRALFDLIITGDDVARHKPSPEAYQLAAQRLAVTPGECLVIEDSDIGVAAGRTFGAPVLRVVMDLTGGPLP